ncbi:hypothetical protein [Epilithonimonas sp. UC225_85]|uniref:hypothetical protein n=1 Tax=Epilithonimonas sp. UC225_85 TaxID=3350167 RepID=UPI0036D352D1
MKTTFPFQFAIGSTIEFKNNTGPNPLMPLVQANYSNTKKNSISVSVNIFINEEVKIAEENISIVQDEQNQYLFFIEYINDMKSNSVKTFRNYRLDFEISRINADNNHGEIVVYLKDDDPTLSRGTVTTVQHNN